MSVNSVQPKRLNILDLLRFGAIVIVVLSHYTDTFNLVYKIVPANLKLNHIFRYGHFSLCILFLISGYVVTMTSVKKTFKDFFITRFSRIYPLFWVSCLAAFLLPRISPLPTFLARPSIIDLVTNLTIIPIGTPLINPVFWTLIMELFLYTFIALLIIFRLWKYILPILTVILVICVFTVKDGYLAVIPRFIPYFIAGILFYLIQVKFAAKWKLYSVLALSLFCSLRGITYLADELRVAYTGQHTYYTWVMWILITLLFAGFFWMINNSLNLPDHPIYQIIGDLSYAFYLFHLYWLGIYWYFRDSIQPQLLLLALLILMIISSWLLNLFIEKPFGKFVKKILTALTGPSALLASLRKPAIKKPI